MLGVQLSKIDCLHETLCTRNSLTPLTYRLYLKTVLEDFDLLERPIGISPKIHSRESFGDR